jgi:4-hydroxybutyrate CoA-transferase
MNSWQNAYKKKLVSAEQVANLVRSDQRILLNSFSVPMSAIAALEKRNGELRNVRIYANFTRDYKLLQPEWENSFALNATFVTRYSRAGIMERRINFVPFSYGLAARPNSFVWGNDFGLIKVTPPDKDGYCSFGPQVWFGMLIVNGSQTVIAEVDPEMAWTYGERVHVSDIDFFVERDPSVEEQYRIKSTDTRPQYLTPPDEQEKASVIGSLIASELIHDGDTIQVGIGTPSEMVLQFLSGKSNLGIDSELVYPQMLELMKSGIVTNRGSAHPGKTVATAVWVYEDDPRQEEVFKFVNRNKSFELLNLADQCSIPRIAKVDNLVAVNTVIGVDLHGQAMVDHLFNTPISGFGGQFDYVMGAQCAKGGRSVAALISVAKQGTISRIVSEFPKGTVIGLPPNMIEYLVTENGIVNLRGKNKRERAEAIISIADPRFQDGLRDEAKRLFGRIV